MYLTIALFFARITIVVEFLLVRLLWVTAKKLNFGSATSQVNSRFKFDKDHNVSSDGYSLFGLLEIIEMNFLSAPK